MIQPKAPPLVEIMRCPDCRDIISKGARCYPACGSKLPNDAVAPTALAMIFSIALGAILVIFLTKVWG